MDTPEYKIAKEAADNQGTKVRSLKESGAPKADIDAAVALLKDLKIAVEKICPTVKEEKKKPAADGADAQKSQEAQAKREEKKRQAQEQLNAKMSQSFESILSEDPNFSIAPLVQSQDRKNLVYTQLSDLTKAKNGEKILVRARLHASRGKGSSVFFVLRQQLHTVQCALFASDNGPSKQVVKWISSIPADSIVDVEANVTAVEKPVVGCSVSDLELSPLSVKVISVAALLPFNIEDASRNISNISSDDALKLTVGPEQRLDNRWIDLRTPANLAIFRIQSAVGTFFRQFLLSENFVEIHSPKIIAAASESGASVFKLGYFGEQAFLAQSPQLYKQMAICADFGKVFEVAPVFRAENSNTHRHLCEFMGLDLEMEIKEHYREILELFGRLFFFIFDSIKEKFGKELEVISQQYPFTPLVYPKDPVIIPFTEGIAMLKEAKVLNWETLTEVSDIDTPTEKALGKLVKQKYNTDFYMMDRYPTNVRPFYTMPCPDDPKFSNSYDFFIRGEEILSGAQRVHDPAMLAARCQELGVSGVDDYINSFRNGAAPHGGGGIGLERVAMLYLGLDNIRKTSLFPRTPDRVRP